MLDANRMSSVQGKAWSRDQSQKNVKSTSDVWQVLSTVTSQQKISEDDDDASDSEKMVIVEDEAAGIEPNCLTCCFSLSVLMASFQVNLGCMLLIALILCYSMSNHYMWAVVDSAVL